MARPRPVPGLHPKLPAIEAARQILAVRLAELMDLAPAAADPAQSQAHHDLRIAAKRLRYSLETFDELFAADLSPLTREMRAVQDHLGRVHDYDVFVPWFERYRDYRRLEADNKLRMTTLAGSGRRAGGRTIADYRAALATAITLYRAMDMTFWLPQAEAALAQVEGGDGP